MADVIGFLVKQSEKPTSNGGTIYSICVEVEGNDEWFGFGFDAPTFGVDSEIEFDVEARGEYENVINDSLVIIDNQNAPAPKRAARGGAGGGGRKPRGSASKPARSPRGSSKAADKPARKPRGSSGAADKPAKKEVDWDRKDNLIRLQSCQNTAVATVALQVTAGTLALPKKKGEQYDALQALIEKEAHRLFLKYDDCADGIYDHDGDDGVDDGDYDDAGGIPE